MRSYCAVYVDVGYLLASAATRVTGSSLRSGVDVEYELLISALVAQVEQDSGLPILRINWYDSGSRPGGQPDWHQDQIGLLPRVKLRLGRLSYSGEQKGVDVRLGLDLALHGHARVADVVYLVSGDDDLTEAVEEAQGSGVQVVLLSVPGPDGRPHGVSKHLQRAADGVLLIDPASIDAGVRKRALPEGLHPHGPQAAGDSAAAGDEVPAGEVATDAAGLEGDAGPGADDAHPECSTGTPAVASPEDAPAAATADPGPSAPTTPRAAGTPGASEGSSAPAVTSTPGASDGPTAPALPAAAADGVPAAADGVPAAADGVNADADGATTKTSSPSPSIFAKRKATEVVLPTAPEPLWSTSTGDLAPTAGSEFTNDTIDAVAKAVVASWCTTATPASLTALREGQPMIPRDLDRALLMDLSSRAGVYDIDDESRHDVRDRFWYHVARVRLV